jgi:hypothetical protein
MLRALAITAIVVAGACTTAMNWRFSYQLGNTTWDSYVWGMFSVALDVAKWLMLTFAASAWPSHKLRALAAVCIWSVATIYSFTAAVGFAALNRDTTAAERQKQVELHKAIATMKQSPRWQSSAACADATSPQSRQFCSEYRAAEAQLTSVPTDPDPQAALLAKLAGLNVETVRLVLSIFLATACEVISAFGFYAILPIASGSHAAPRSTSKQWSPPPWRQVTNRDTARHVTTGRDTARPVAT